MEIVRAGGGACFFLPSSLFIHIFYSSFFILSGTRSLSLQSIRWYTKCIHNSRIFFAQQLLVRSQSGASLSSLLPCFLASFCCLFFYWPHSSLSLSRSETVRVFPSDFGFGFGFGFSGPGRHFFFFSLHLRLHCIGGFCFVLFPFPHVARPCSRCTLFFLSPTCDEERGEEREREGERVAMMGCAYLCIENTIIDEK